MSVFEEALSEPGSVHFGTDDDPLDVFARLRVVVPFDSDRRRRRPVEETVAGHPGRWVHAYSSLARMNAALGDDIEHSQMRGGHLLALISDRVGIWLDRSYPGGRMILLPLVDFSTGSA
jgi:hypothetical protein